MAPTRDIKPKGGGRSSKQMALAIVGTVLAALIIFGGGAYLFTKLFNGGTFHTFDDTNTMKLVAGTYSNPLEAEGTIKAASGISVSPEVDGTVDEVLVEDGDEVKKGDVLFTLSNGELKDAADEADTTYQRALEAQEEAQKFYDKAKANLKSAEKKLEEVQKKIEAEQKAAAKAAAKKAADAEATDAEADDEAQETEPPATVAFDTEPYETAVASAQDTLKDAKKTLKSAKASAESAQSAYETASNKLKNLKVRAPRSGTVASMRAEEGMTTGTLNSGGAAVRIIDLDSLVGSVKVPEAYISSIYVDQQCTVETAGTQDATGSSTAARFNATISKIADTPDKAKKGSSEVNYSVQLTLDAFPEQIKDGMSITAKIDIHDYGTVYYVPPGAVGEDTTGAYVEIVFGDKTTKQQEVNLLDMSEEGEAIIQGSGIAENMTIRTDIG